MKKLLLLILLAVFISANATPQNVRINFRLDYYMTELEAELLVSLPDLKPFETAQITLTGQNFTNLVLFQAIPDKEEIVTIPVDITNLPHGVTSFEYAIQAPGLDTAGTVKLTKRPYKFNAVQVDRKTGGVVTRGMGLIPMGFFCYSPVQPMIQEEEVVRGFNMISPYQNIPRTDITMRKVYMDRAAELGMKVNYNLLSVATGGTGFDRSQNPAERDEMFRKEIETFKDHPALLSWYLGDEPDGRGTTPESLIRLYNMIKSIDPYHPVSMVFMYYGSETKFIDCYDIAMGDLYPVPRHPVANVSRFQKAMSDAVFLKKGVWLVPQAFGGNEWWTREPTRGEMRAATYMGLVHGTTGFQYFIRHGQNGFPKSTTAWAEAGAMALEFAEMTPYILSGEFAPKAFANDTMVDVRAWKRGENLMIAAVNKENKPKDVTIVIDGWHFTGEVKVPFENRQQSVFNGIIMDKMLGFDTKVYKLEADPKFLPVVNPQNVVVDPDFEMNTSVGVPNGVYAQVGKGRGSTYFIDSRTAYTGEHSLRLITHKTGEGVTLEHFPMIVDSARTYTISFYAKAGDKGEFPLQKHYVDQKGKVQVEKVKAEHPILSVNLRHRGRRLLDTKVKIDSSEWKRYTVDVFVDRQPNLGREGLVLSLTLGTRSMIWIDNIEFLP
ncbi:MAG: hypothetical protein FWD56_02075 [Bacteroidales bacterium]|nr:hypothetical protein [Bacteroidales bacterium]